MIFFKAGRCALLLILLGVMGSAQAGISLSTTRVIFEGGAQENSLLVRNNDIKKNVLIQSWIESNSPEDKGDLLFAMTPPVSKIAPNGQQLLRVLYAGGENGMPKDKESVLWLNVQEIPPDADEVNTLQIAVRQRIKMFYRPSGLPGNAIEAPLSLQWKVVERNGAEFLQVENPTAFHVSTASIEVGAGDDFKQVAKGQMIAPQERVEIPLEKVSKKSELRFISINDFGGSEHYQARISGDVVVTATLSK